MQIRRPRGTTMARARSDLPRMQKQSPTRAPLERAVAVAQVVEKPAQSRKPPMMRQYDLIERVRRYNPKTNEALLNRAYVYAMKAHGEQRRASGDPYFSPPIEGAAILTDPQPPPFCKTALRIPRPPAPGSTACSGPISARWSTD